MPFGSCANAKRSRRIGIDRLRFDHYVEAFADLIDSPDTTPPLTIGIFGAWGAGKSFLLQKLIAKMDERRIAARDASSSANQRAPVYTVSFNAWEYNAALQIWPRLVRRVLDSVESSLDWSVRARIRLRRLGPNLRRKAAEDWKSILAWFGIVTFLGLLVQSATDTATHVFQFTIGKTIEKLTFPGLVGALVSLAALLVKSFIAPLGEWITAALDDGRSYGLSDEGGPDRVPRRPARSNERSIRRGDRGRCADNRVSIAAEHHCRDDDDTGEFAHSGEPPVGTRGESADQWAETAGRTGSRIRDAVVLGA